MRYTVFYPKKFDPLAAILEKRTAEPRKVRKEDYSPVTHLEEKNPDRVYKTMQAIDSKSLPLKLHVRSMSCGDLVEGENGELHMVLAVGWQKAVWE